MKKNNNDFIGLEKTPQIDQEEMKPPDMGGVWDRLRKKRHPIETIIPKDVFAAGSPHYYEITDFAKAEVACTSCSVKHGGILEAHLLTRYEVKDGVIYLDGKPMTKSTTNTT